MEININDLPDKGRFYIFTGIAFIDNAFNNGVSMEQLTTFMGSPEVLPAEPVTKPAPTIQPVERPDENDPWNVPIPKKDIPIKGAI